MSNALMTAYNPRPVRFTHGDGVWLWDTQGEKYLDALGGIAVCGLGHAHPAITEAIIDQAKKLLHTSNAYHIDWQEKLAEKLTQISGMHNAFFCNSGAEANEAAFKLCRLYGHQQGKDNPQIIVMESAFHGRTLAALSASGSRKVQAGFEPLVQGFIRAPYNDMNALKNIAGNSQNVVAIMLEPIQGEGGIHIPDPGYLKNIRKLCDDNHWLMVLDEVQTGVARTGQFYAYQHEGILPDILTTAKALGNGIPIGACLAANTASQLFQPGNHGSTFGGNPLATRVAHTVIEVIEHDQLITQAATRGKQLREGLQQALSAYDNIVEIRGQGCMLGIEFTKPCHELLMLGLKHKLLFNITANTVVRLLPPYIITEEHVALIIERLVNCVEEYTHHD
jgi:acetylornithine/N-succinyldiaminopimelate aminotransferase